MKNYLNKVFKPVAKERIDIVANLMLQLVGETVRGHALRAILMGAITAGAQYAKDAPDAPIQSAPAVSVQSPQSK
jgi:predicted PurR-regulated permease PerM